MHVDISSLQIYVCLNVQNVYVTYIVKKIDFYSVIFAMPSILIICCILIYFPRCTRVCYCHIIIFELSLCYLFMLVLAIVLLLWVMTGTVYVLTDFMHALMYIYLWFFFLKNNINTVTVITVLDCNHVSWVSFLSFLILMMVSYADACICVLVCSLILLL